MHSTTVLLDQTMINGCWVGHLQLDGLIHFLLIDIDKLMATIGSGRRPQQPVTLSMEGHTVEIQIVHEGREVRLLGAREAGTLIGAVVGEQENPFTLYRVESVSTDVYDPYISYYRTDENAPPVLMSRGNTTDFLYLFSDPEEIRIFSLANDRFYSETGALIEGQRDHTGQIRGLRWLTPAGIAARYKRVSLYEEEEIAFRSGNLTLMGSLLRPVGPGPHPTVVFVHGSGPESRERYRSYAAYLARHGIAGFIYDKRGIGNSEGSWILAGFDEMAGDVLAAVKALQDHPNVDSTQVGLWSLSQGGWIAPLAAAHSNKDIGFLIVVSGAGITPGQQEQYLVGSNLSALDVPNRYIDAIHKLIWLKNDLLSLLQQVVPASLRARLPQMDFYMDLTDILPRIEQPVLLIHGEKDRHLPPLLSTHRYQAALGDNLTVCFFADASHGIMLENVVGSRHPVRQFAPGYFEAMRQWVIRQASPETAAVSLPGESSFSNDLPTEAVNLVHPPLLGRAWVQIPLILYFLLTLGSALFFIPFDYFHNGIGAQNVASLALVVAVVDMLLLAGTAWFLIQIIGISASRHAQTLNAAEILLLALLLTSGVLTLVLAQGVLQQLYNSPYPQIYYGTVTLAAALFPFFIAYWWWPAFTTRRS